MKIEQHTVNFASDSGWSISCSSGLNGIWTYRVLFRSFIVCSACMEEEPTMSWASTVLDRVSTQARKDSPEKFVLVRYEPANLPLCPWKRRCTWTQGEHQMEVVLDDWQLWTFIPARELPPQGEFEIPYTDCGRLLDLETE